MNREKKPGMESVKNWWTNLHSQESFRPTR